MSETTLTTDEIERARRSAKAELHPDHIGDSENLCGPFPCACAGCEHNRLIIALCDAAARAEALESEKEADWNGQARWQGYLNDLRDARQATTKAQAERDTLAAQLTEVTRERDSALGEAAALAPLRAVVGEASIVACDACGRELGSAPTFPPCPECIGFKRAKARALPADPSAPTPETPKETASR